MSKKKEPRIIKKITAGFVTQTFDKELGQFTEQNFTASDQVDWKDESGIPVEDQGVYLNFDMVQPVASKYVHPKGATPHAKRNKS
jgi:hypothetical protein